MDPFTRRARAPGREPYSRCDFHSPLEKPRPPRHNQSMLRQKWGSVVCPSCGNLVGVNDERCFTCGRWNPGMWGFAPALNRFGRDLGFTLFVMGACGVL